MSRVSVIGAWLLLLVSSLTLGGIALRLLGNEEDRLATATRAAAMEHADAVAGSIALAVADVQEGLTASLLALRGRDVATALSDWRRSNPLIRNVFVQAPDGTVVVPNPDRPGTEEAAGFLTRFEALFTGRVAWSGPDSEGRGATLETAMAQTTAAAQVQQRSVAQKSFRSNRQELVALSKNTVQQGAADATDPPASGWISWSWENRLHLLGWVQDDTGRYGVELEVMAVLSRLVESIPDPTFADGVLALVDDRGRIMHQRGALIIDAETPRLASVPIGELLPHWQVSIYAPPGGGAAPGGRAMILITGLVVSTFVCTLLLGGGLLMWQTQRSLRDAQQKTSFVSNVSHELKTPLTTIRMYAELMGEERITDEDKRRRYLGVIVEESRRLTRLVNNVLDFSRLEQGRKKYRLESIELWDLLRDTLDTHLPRLEQAGMTLETAIPDLPCPLRTDRDAVEQALLNVIDNAIKYADRGGSVSVRAKAEPARAVIHILDRGPGIPPDQRELVFEKFHRVDDSLTAARTGSGLGLSIARRLLRDLGGDLRTAEREGGGSIFSLIVPRTEFEAGKEEAPA